MIPTNRISGYNSVFFDLDGTLADTAPDLVAATNQLRIDRNLEPLPFEILRNASSKGARGLLEVAFQITPEDANFAKLRDEFFINYENAIHVHSYLFEGIEDVLLTLESQNIPWGIITNKIERFTTPLVKSMKLDERCAAIVSGDSTPTPKPHPAPILLAADRSGIDPTQSLYVGDDLRDIEAGKAAGMKTVAVTYGYATQEDPPHQWNADFIINHPSELIDIIFPR